VSSKIYSQASRDAASILQLQFILGNYNTSRLFVPKKQPLLLSDAIARERSIQRNERDDREVLNIHAIRQAVDNGLTMAIYVSRGTGSSGQHEFERSARAFARDHQSVGLTIIGSN
jgi:hypothetical protein